MQAFRQWAANVEQVNFQTFAASLRELPQQLFGRSEDAAEHEAGRLGRVSGSGKFRLTLKFDPRSEAPGTPQSGVLAATCTSLDGGRPVPVKYHWRRRVGEVVIKIPGVHGNLYHISADDLGMELECVAEPVGNPSLGMAAAILGPISLDSVARLSLGNLLNSGSASFPARYYRDQDDPHPRDLQIRVTPEAVKVIHPGVGAGAREVSAPFGADYPRVIIHAIDTNKFRLEMGEDPEMCYEFQALSRTSRDLIALLIRSLVCRRYVAISHVLTQLSQNPATPGAPPSAPNPSSSVDLAGMQGRLAKELKRTVDGLEGLQKTVRNAHAEKIELQAQLRETIGSYTDAIEKLHGQLASARGGSALTTTLQLQLHEVRSSNSKKQLELHEERQRRDELQPLIPQGGTGNVEQQQAQIRAEIQQLRQRILALSGDQQDSSKRDLTRVEELRRMRADVEMLHKEREALEQNKMQADQEIEDIKSNGATLKDAFNSMQEASLEAPAASPEHERAVASLRADHRQIVEERNRLAGQVDQLDREREKRKHERETKLEQIMNANARLLEERDRLEREKVRLSALYQETMGALGALAQRPAGTSTDAASSAAAGAAGEEVLQPADLEALRAELAAATDLLEKRQLESESLRARLRKLAMV